MATEKELYNLQISIQKALNGLEVPLKVKHARAIIISTFRTAECSTLWEMLKTQPLMEQRFTAWKFCHLLHKVLREGHHSIISASIKNRKLILQIGLMWVHLNDGVGICIDLYSKLLVMKIDFHRKNPAIPGSMLFELEELEKHSHNDINYYFELAVEVFDYLDSIVDLQSKIFSNIHLFRMSSMTPQGQCRLAPLIPMIQDSNQLYDLIVRLMFKLHSKLSNDTLQGHRERFRIVFSKLKEFYSSVKPLAYFADLIQVPALPESAPNFSSKIDLGSYVPPVVVIPEPPPEQVVDNLIDTETQQAENQIYERELNLKDQHIEHLRYEINSIVQMQNLEREEMKALKLENKSLLEKIHMLESDLIKTQNINSKLENCASSQIALEEKLQTEEEKQKLNEEKFVKLKTCYAQIRDEHIQLLRKNAETSKVLSNLQNDFTNMEKENSDLKFKLEEFQEKENVFNLEKSKEVESLNEELEKVQKDHFDLKDTYDKLLLDYNEANEKHGTFVKKTNLEIDNLKRKSEEYLAIESNLKERISQSDTNENKLKLELVELSNENLLKQRTCNELHEQIAVIESKNNELLSDMLSSKENCETLSSKNLELMQTNQNLLDEIDKLKIVEEKVIKLDNNVKEKEEALKSNMLILDKLTNDKSIIETKLQNSIQAINKLENTLECKNTFISELETVNNNILRSVIIASENMARESDYNINIIEVFQDSSAKITDLTSAYMKYKEDSKPFAEYYGKSIIAAGHCLGTLQKQCLKICNACPNIQAGEEISNKLNAFFQNDILEMFNILKENQPFENTKLKLDEILIKLSDLSTLIQTITVNEDREKTADQLETELALMDKAIQEASDRISEMLLKSRQEDTGIDLEVNEKILDCCTKLIQSIVFLVQKSRLLQHEIVKLGKGNASVKEYYKRNNQWTDGLISAAKNVGIGANLLVEAANKAVSGEVKHRFDIIAAAQEIAASTTQLVVASRVKAPKESKNLEGLASASKVVSQATGEIVATVKDCNERLDSKDDFDVTKLTVHQLKTMEIEIQVKVLELEQSLQMERQKLASFRKRNYNNVIEDH